MTNRVAIRPRAVGIETRAPSATPAMSVVVVAGAAGGAAAVAAKAVRTLPLDKGPMVRPNPTIATHRASVSSILPASNRRHRLAKSA